MTGASLIEALEAVEAALAASDAAAAEAAAGRADAIAAALSAAGARLTDTERARAGELHRRCTEIAAAAHHALGGALALAGQSRRATGAYRQASARQDEPT